jgi:Putative redox-active protein (C_GCAxxG_C_C)
MTGGIGGMADACGSLIGAGLILGAVCGLGREDGDQGMPKLGASIKQAGDFYKWFRDKQGSANCREIVTRFGNGVYYDFGIPEQAKAGIEAGILEKCTLLVEDNSARVAEILWDILRK